MDKRIGAQFYTIRDHIQTIDDFEKSCKNISDIGYKTVQISGSPLEAKPIKEVLDKYNLEVVTTHRSYNDFCNKLDEVIEYNKILGCDLCGLGSMPFEYAKSNEKLSEFFKTTDKICQTLKKEGMFFGYHNHAFEFLKNDGKLVFDRMVEETDSEIFNFIVDTFWVQVGGKNAADVIKNLGSRAMAVHFKDYAVCRESWSEHEMCEVGNGNLDWDNIIDACEKAGTRYALVEQDNNWKDNNPFEALRSSYNFLTTKGFY